MAYQRNRDRVMEVLHRWAGDDGYVDGLSWPEICAESGLSKNSVYRVLYDLQRRGELKVYRSRGRGLTNRYQLTEAA